MMFQSDNDYEPRRAKADVGVINAGGVRENIASAIDRIDAAIEGLMEAVEGNRRKVEPVLNMATPSESSYPQKDRTDGSALQQTLHERADRIERIVYQIQDVNIRIDL